MSLKTQSPTRCVVESLEPRLFLAGNGLAATYWGSSSPTYSSSLNFSGPNVSRIDPTVGFNWNSGSPSPLIALDHFSARWTGQVAAPTTGTYTFYAKTDDGVKLWVNGVLLIDDWRNQAATETKGSISLVGGQRYDVRMEYYENATNAVAQLRWSGPAIAKAIIPQSVLYSTSIPVAPSGLAATATSSGQMQLSWSDNSNNEDGFAVLRSTNGTDFAQIASTAADTTSYTDSGLTAGVTYYYRVAAYNVAGSSAFSATSAVAASAHVYYVATNGNNANAGTLTAPFGTIQQAANVAMPGDTVYVRGGTYRETVRPATSGTAQKPIIFEPYPNEQVTISGADLISGWTSTGGAIYRATMPWTLGQGNDQVFVDGQMMNEARWPNTSLDISRPVKAYSDGGGYTTKAGASVVSYITDSDLIQPNGFWNGATLHIADPHDYLMYTATVISYTAGRLTYLDPSGAAGSAGRAYYLTGNRQSLDSTDEWFRDAGSSTLSLWTPAGDNPSSHLVEAKRRQYAFDLTGRSFVTVQGFNIVASTIVTDSLATHDVIDGINAKYVSYYSLTDNGWNTHMTDTGIILDGSYNVLENSTIQYSAGNGVSLLGSYNRVTNNIIHDVDYAGTDNAAISTGYGAQSTTQRVPQSVGQEISYNTLYDAGRSLIVHRNLSAGKIVYNDMYRAGLQMDDLGATYSYYSDGGGTVIAYNYIHDIRGNGAGIYLDSMSSNYIVHHNVVSNVAYGMIMNGDSLNDLVYNNTLLGTLAGIGHMPTNAGEESMTGTSIINNVLSKPPTLVRTAGRTPVQQNNLYPSSDSWYVNVSAGDYGLTSGSPPVNAGAVLPGYTDGYVGTAPDVGAYELGATRWLAGSSPVSASALVTHSALQRTYAKYYDDMRGIVVANGGVGYFDPGDWLAYRQIDLGSGVSTFTIEIGVDPAYAGRQIQLRLDSPTGQLIGTLTTTSTGGFTTYGLLTTAVTGAVGVHDLYLVGNGGYGIGNLRSFVFGQ